MNQGIHAADLLLWFAGMPEQVKALAGTLAHPEIEVEDTLTASLRFAGGALGTIECATSCAPGTPLRIELCGTRGSATLEQDRIIRWDFDETLPGDEVWRQNRDKIVESGATDPRAIGGEGHRRVLADMTKAIREGRPPLVAGEEGRKAVALIESIYASAFGTEAIGLTNP